MTQLTTLAPRPLSASELSAKRRQLELDGKIGCVLACILIGLLLFGSLADPISEHMKNNLLTAGSAVAVFLYFSVLRNILGMTALVEAGLSGARLAWLCAASEQVAAVEQFLAEVRAQERNLLAREFESLEAYYGEEVERALPLMV